MGDHPDVFIGYAGSRDFPELELVKESVLNLPDFAVVVSGGARGVDRMAEKTAADSGLPVISFRPFNTADGSRFPWRIERWLYKPFEDEWERFVLPTELGGFAAAAHVRNTFIVETADRVNLFWDGRSRGTKDTLRKCEALGVDHELVRIVPKEATYIG